MKIKEPVLFGEKFKPFSVVLLFIASYLFILIKLFNRLS